MWFLQKWWPWPWSLSDFHQKNLPGSLELSTFRAVKFSEMIGPVVWPVHRDNYGQTNRHTDKQTDRQTDRQTVVTNILCKNLRFCKVTNRGDQYTLQKSTILQSNERALLECILCKIGLTDWVIYLVDWLWQRSRTQSIGPSDSNEKCAMSRVLFRINIAAIQKIRDLDLIHLTLTFSLDLWPWYLTLILICYYLEALKKTLQKFIVLTSCDAKTAPHSLARRPTYRLVFFQ